jgi:hypothetical protein
LSGGLILRLMGAGGQTTLKQSVKRKAVTQKQVQTTRDVVRWYLEMHYDRAGDVGLARTFCDPSSVGYFAVDLPSLEAGRPEALFRLFVTVAMFQRLRDTLVMNILRSLCERDSSELTSVAALLRCAETSPCSLTRSNEDMLGRCDLRKDALKRGTCSVAPQLPCHLKRHTELLKRYGHFGKMPTSAALVVRDHGGDLNTLKERVFAAVADPLGRAQQLESTLSNTWRVSDKIANMFLSLVSAPNLGLPSPPWADGLDWTWFVVVDGNVDLFLGSIGYLGSGTYSARRMFVRELASRIDLSLIDRRLPAFHPRLVQQAMYLFKSASNRKAADLDCCHGGKAACSACLPRLRRCCDLIA